MPKHLSKCRLSTETSGFKTCRFNCNHIYCKAEIAVSSFQIFLNQNYEISFSFKSHESTCPDRIWVELAMVSDMKPKPNDTKPVILTSNLDLSDDEDNWDSVSDVTEVLFVF